MIIIRPVERMFHRAFFWAMMIPGIKLADLNYQVRAY